MGTYPLILRLTIVGVAILFLGFGWKGDSVRAGETRLAWQVAWEKTVEAAKKDGQVAIYGPAGDESVYVDAFQKAFPDIRVGYTGGRMSQLISRIMSERRAGKYLVDLVIGGPDVSYLVMKPAGILRPIRPLLLLPEVLDASAWFKNKLWFGDNEEKYVVFWRGGVTGELAINTNLAKAEEFNTYFDVLNPKWKGKIVAQDPRAIGRGGTSLYRLTVHPDFGPDYVKRLYGEMDITLSRNIRQIVDWLGHGKFAIALFVPKRYLARAIQQRLPIARVRFERGLGVSPGAATASLLTRAPHPDAARAYINWLLSREGQMAYQRATGENSLRKDIPKKGIVDLGSVPKEGREYIFSSSEHHKNRMMGKEFQQFLKEVFPHR